MSPLLRAGQAGRQAGRACPNRHAIDLPGKLALNSRFSPPHLFTLRDSFLALLLLLARPVRLPDALMTLGRRGGRKKGRAMAFWLTQSTQSANRHVETRPRFSPTFAFSSLDAPCCFLSPYVIPHLLQYLAFSHREPMGEEIHLPPAVSPPKQGRLLRRRQQKSICSRGQSDMRHPGEVARQTFGLAREGERGKK